MSEQPVEAPHVDRADKPVPWPDVVERLANELADKAHAFEAGARGCILMSRLYDLARTCQAAIEQQAGRPRLECGTQIELDAGTAPARAFRAAYVVQRVTEDRWNWARGAVMSTKLLQRDFGLTWQRIVDVLRSAVDEARAAGPADTETLGSPAPGTVGLSDEDRERLDAIPPLDKDSGEWLKQIDAARFLTETTGSDDAEDTQLAERKVEALKKARGRGLADDASEKGIDRQHQAWRIDPDTRARFWYLKSTLARSTSSDSAD